MANAWRAVVVERPGGPHLVGPPLRRVEGLQQRLPVAEPLGGQVRRTVAGPGTLRAGDRVVFEAERVVQPAERPAALADDRLLALVQLAADDQERRQLAVSGAFATVA